MNQQKIFVIVPVFNEDEAVLKRTLQDLLSLGYNIILVDDGSDNDVEEIARKYPIIFLRHRLNLGQGAALQTGMRAAQNLAADIVVHFDADGQHDANEIQKLIEPLSKNECDIVFGSRFLNNKDKQSISASKKIVLQTGRYVNRIFYGILLSDAHNGFRAIDKDAIKKITITQNRMAHASEILHLVKKKLLRYKEVPVTIHYTEYSKQKGQSIFNSVNILFDLIFKKLNR
ncbi:MAG TPA: glycosyltransferase family 2 protein [Puia sp.]|nr:glycosyltransferase family 2 protein [Puia sp.]